MNHNGPRRNEQDVDVESHELLRRVAKGDERALEGLYERYASAVYGFVARRISDHGVREEVCADVWLACWRSAPAFRADSRVLTWLLGIASRQTYTHTRRKRLTTVPIETVESVLKAESTDPAEQAASQLASEELVNVLKSLPRDLYEVIVLAWLQDLPYEEIGAVLSIPVGTVKSRVSRARRLLKQQMGARHG